MPGGIRRAALLTAALTLAGSAFGLVRDIAIAVVFGAGSEVDAFLVAQGLMNLVLALIAGALAQAAIPVVSRAVDAGRPGAGLATVRAALGLACVVLGVGATSVWLGAGAVVEVLAPGFDPATAALAVDLTRIVLVATVLIAATNLLAGAGQALGRFGPAALQGVGFNVVMVGAAVLAGPVFGIRALAWGFVLGSAVRLVMQFPPLLAIGVRPWPSVRWRDPGLTEMVRLVPALLVGSALSNVNSLVDRAVASTVSEGAVSAVNFAARLSSTVHLLLVATLLAALYPRLAAAAVPGRSGELRVLVGRGIGVLVVALVPVAAGLALAAGPVVRLVYGYGAFDAAAIALTASAAAVFAVGIPVLAVREVAARTAYALGDGSIPVWTAVVGMVVNVTGDLLLAPRFGVAGIAVATVASLVVAAGTALVWLHRRHAVVPRLGRFAAGVLASATAGVVLGVLARWAVLAGAGPVAGPGNALLVSAAVGVAVLVGYLPVLRLTCPEEFRMLADVPREVLRARRR